MVALRMSASGLTLLAMASGVQAQGTWTTVVPEATALSDGQPPSSFLETENTISPVGVSSALDARPALLQTNKFYAGFLIDGPDKRAWTLPYTVSVNDELPFGMYVSMPNFFEGDRSEVDDRLEWYATTTTIKDVIMSAQELYTNQVSTLTGADDAGFSATVEFTSEDVSGSMTTFLVRGMAYATAMYQGFTPEISSIHAIVSVNGNAAASGTHTSTDGRFIIELNDGNTWILYSSETDLELTYVSAQPNEPNALKANMAMTGTLQVARVPYDEDDPMYTESVNALDAYAGTYATKGTLKAWIDSTDNSRGMYAIEWTTAGDGSELLHYALPHQQALLSSSSKTGLYLRSPTKGDMELITGSTWIMVETDLADFEWVPSMSAITNPLEMEWIEFYLENEINAPLDNTAGPSVYFGAKHMMAYAQLCLIAEELGKDELMEACVDQVEAAFDVYLQHQNGNPLVYDTIWGGVIGSLGLEEGNEGADFYAVFYNDHHFHYSYVVHAAAVLAHLRPSWANDGNRAWVETLIRDANDPNDSDPYFPQFRAFDWFCGHSWARGLLYSGDGKDQESTSEDVNFVYAMTMWALATGNTKLEGLGRLQTGVVTRSINDYFLLKDDNTNHPADFVRNKVTGILFESKVDYTTWFGDNVEYIHGIQNIPVTAITESVRDAEFVSQEWDQRLGSIVDDAAGVWKTVLYMSYATVQKHVAFKEMLSSGVDDGLLRAWALYWAATRPECATYCSHEAVELGPTPVPTPAPVIPTGPFGGSSAVVPGLIEAEGYDFGGQGVGYFDTDAGNNGGAFRTDDVDISATTDGFAVGWARADEYLRYTVNVEATAASYDFIFKVAAPPGLSGSFRIVSGGNCDEYTIDLSGIVPVPSTGDWNAYESVAWSNEGTGGLPAGETTIYLCVIEAGFNIDSFTLIRNAPAGTPAPTPSPTTNVTPSPITFPAGYVGCYADKRSSRIMTFESKSPDMTAEECSALCSGSTYFGTQYSTECWCGDENFDQHGKSTSCNRACAGDASEICGGTYAMSVYMNKQTPTPVPTPSQPAGYVGCFTDDRAGRIMTDKRRSNDMTAEVCSALCASSSFYGTQYSTECWCGDDNYDLYGQSNRCTMACAGDSDELCGGSYAMSVYENEKPVPPGYVGCFTDKSPGRIMTDQRRSGDMTAEVCSGLCASSAYYGTQFSRECWCGDDDYDQYGTSTGCTMACTGDSDELCGGRLAMSVYENEQLAPTAFVGCFADKRSDRIMTQKRTSADMTAEVCSALCGDSSFYGTQYSSECWCGDEDYNQHGTSTSCNMACAGDANEECGGTYAMSVYQK